MPGLKPTTDCVELLQWNEVLCHSESNRKLLLHAQLPSKLILIHITDNTDTCHSLHLYIPQITLIHVTDNTDKCHKEHQVTENRPASV